MLEAASPKSNVRPVAPHDATSNPAPPTAFMGSRGSSQGGLEVATFLWTKKTRPRVPCGNTLSGRLHEPLFAENGCGGFQPGVGPSLQSGLFPFLVADVSSGKATILLRRVSGQRLSGCPLWATVLDGFRRYDRVRFGLWPLARRSRPESR